MVNPWLFQRVGFLFVVMVFNSCTGVRSQLTEKISHVGGSVTLECGHSNPQWYRNGTKLNTTRKITISGNSLSIFCCELSDNGMYECKDGVRRFIPARRYKVIVKNRDNVEFFHIYNKNQKKCLSRTLSDLHAEQCDMQSCKQKWMWTDDRRLVSVLDFDARECISPKRQTNSSDRLGVERCSNTSLRWECIDHFVKLKDDELYLIEENQGHEILLSPYTGHLSTWVKFSTRDNICTKNRKAIVNPTHVVEAERKTVKLTCNGINFYQPTYSWFKNGKIVDVSRSSKALHIDTKILFFPFAYKKSSGNYTCMVKDKWGAATASVIIEVYENPSVISDSINQTALFGKDVCLTCEMFVSNTSYQINWFMGSIILSGNQKYKINTRTRMFKKVSTELCITSLNLGDSGTFSCEIKMATKRAIAQGKLQVFARPTVYIYRVENILVCNATGFPQSRLTWYKDGKYIKDNKNHQKSLTIKETGGNFTCVASNMVGTSSKSFITTIPVPTKSNDNSVVIIVLCIIGIVLLAILIIFCVCFYRRKKKETRNNNSEATYDLVRYTATPDQTTVQSEYTTVDHGTPHQKPRIEFHPRSKSEPGKKRFDLKSKYQSLKPRTHGEWEVPYECINFENKLGEGQFGQVWKGNISGRKGSRTVAIKMLREGVSGKERKALIDELEFMKTMSPHPNIVGLVGCCTRSEKVMIIVEYVPGGNLKDYLLNSRGNSKDTYGNLAPFSTTLTAKDLLTFAYEIARGMSYLEQIKCVHRDLAARNVLIGDDKACKIADFGLARDIYAENYYRKTNGGRLPLRWMAYESIFNGITTNQSDAWSFGVLLWEIVTLGGNPYPDMNRDEVIDGLQRGYRMPKPHHCSDEVYNVMWECWQQNPDRRPTFAELTATFLRLISLQENCIRMENFGEDDYVNVGSYEETEDC